MNNTGIILMCGKMICPVCDKWDCWMFIPNLEQLLNTKCTICGSYFMQMEMKQIEDEWIKKFKNEQI